MEAFRIEIFSKSYNFVVTHKNNIVRKEKIAFDLEQSKDIKNKYELNGTRRM